MPASPDALTRLLCNSMNPPTHLRKLHIAFAIPSLASGGAGRVILAIARGLVARGHRIDIVMFRTSIHHPEEVADKARLFVVDDEPDRTTKLKPGYAALRERMMPVESRCKRFGWLRLARALRWHPLVLPTRVQHRQACQMANYIDEQKPDIVFTTLTRSVLSALFARHLLDNPPPVIPIIQGVIEEHRRHKQIRYRALFPGAAHVVAVSNGVADSVADRIGMPKERVTTIYNPVASLELDVLKSQMPDHPWLKDQGPPIILGCGRLIELKGFAVLIKAFARLVEQRQCRLIILGKGPQQKELEALVARLGLQGKASLPGHTDNPFAFMSRAALFVLSSRTEGLPTAIIEALACGCPCVSTDCPSGPAEILQGGAIGPLVPVGDHAALADAIARTLDNPPDKRKLTTRAGFFSTERAVKMYENLMLEKL